MDDKITIIEGPPPTFEPINEGWVLGLNESPNLSNIVMTRLRTFNGAGLVERCHRAWSKNNAIHLEYRSMDGLESLAPIVAARTIEIPDGQMLLLWVRTEMDEAEQEAGLDDDFGDETDDDLDFPDL